MRGIRLTSCGIPGARDRNKAIVGMVSTAPRYIGLTRFALMRGIDPRQLTRWRKHNGPVWVPAPDVVVGEQQRPGWAFGCVNSWTPGMDPYVRPEPVVYADTEQMQAKFNISAEVLWLCIARDQTFPMPAVWRDDEAGWSIT